jgi:predicted AlkP superfamily phosphohydrolase/phosphomutase
VKTKKVMVIGLDCAAPELVFERWIDELPHLKRLIYSGVSGRLRSTDPPITVPAWASMVTSKDPGQLGFYGFRNRVHYGYGGNQIVDSTDLREPTIWDILGTHGLRSIVIGVPPSYPPKPINGCLISCFLTPDRSYPHTFPAKLAEEIEREVGEYQFDVENFRTHDVEALLKQIYEMTRTRFATARYLIQNKPWDFFMMVEMGTDRIHHAFWHYMDEQHVLHRPSPYKDAILEYYRFVDREIGQLLELVDDDTVVMVVSDHGAKRMDGGFCINEWLIRQGLLKLKQPVDRPTPLTPDLVDWKQTRAWGYGGYYGRLCINVKGREPHGIVPRSQYEWLRNRIVRQLRALKDEKGNPLKTRVIKPERKYVVRRNIPPDLLIYFGDLYWRSVGSVGMNSWFVYENDTGPDGANHDYEGIFIAAKKGAPVGTEPSTLNRLHLMDVTPTILREFGVPRRKGMRGKSIPISLAPRPAIKKTRQ